MSAVWEEWRPVPGYEGAYQVSDKGGVRSLDRAISMPAGYGHSHRKSTEPYQRKVKGKQLTVKLSGGQPVVDLRAGDGGPPERVYVKKLVREVFWC